MVGPQGLDDEVPTSQPIEYDSSTVERLVRELEKAGDLSLELQASTMASLSRIWSRGMTEQQRTRAEQFLLPRLERFHGLEPEEQHRRFQQVVHLPSEVEVRRAVTAHAEELPQYEIQPEERTYLKERGWLGEYLSYCHHNHVPLGFHYWVGMLVLGAVSRRNIYIDLGLGTSYLNHYMFLVGPSGQGGKSAAAEVGVDMLRRVNRHVDTLSFRENRTVYDEDRATWRGDGSAWHINILAQDSTPEAIVDELYAIGKRREHDELGHLTPQFVDCTGLLYMDEVSVHFGPANWAVEKKGPLYTSIYATDSFEKVTSGKGRKYLKNLCFSMLGCGDPVWFKSAVTEHILKGGFVDRSLYIYRPATRRIYDPLSVPMLDPLAAEDLAQRLVQLTRPDRGGFDLSRPARFTPDAERYIKERYREERQKEIDMGGVLPTRRTTVVRGFQYILKVATTLAISEQLGRGLYPLVDISHVIRADEVLTIEEESNKRFFEMIRERSDAEIYDLIEQFFWENELTAYHSELVQRFKRRNITSKALKMYMNTLIDEGSVERFFDGRKEGYRWLKAKS